MQYPRVLHIRTKKHQPSSAPATRARKAVVCALDSAKRSDAARRMARNVVRKLEGPAAARIAGRDALDGAIGPDEAVAICIGYALLRSGELWIDFGWELA